MQRAVLLVIFAIVLAGRHGLATAECDPTSPGACEAACLDGDAIACHTEGERLLDEARYFELEAGKSVERFHAEPLMKAREVYAQACAKEFTWSCYALVEHDRKRAAKWRRMGLSVDRRLCMRKKEPWACARLGLVYKEGKVIGKRPKLAFQLLKRACNAGDSTGCAHLGVAYLDGMGTHRQVDKGISLLDKGCAEGLSWLCIRLAHEFKEGTVLKQDRPRAEELLRRACERKHQQACVLLGRLLDETAGEAGSAEAVELFRHACAADDPSGCVNLGDLYETGRGVRKDLRRAAALFEPACNRYVGGCMRIGRLYEQGLGVDKDEAKARTLYEAGCTNSDPNACFHLALSLRESAAIPERDRAEAMLRDQCTKGRALSCQVLGDMAEKTREKRRLYRKACKLGREQACEADKGLK